MKQIITIPVIMQDLFSNEHCPLDVTLYSAPFFILETTSFFYHHTLESTADVSVARKDAREAS